MFTRLLGQGPAGQSGHPTGAAWLCAAPAGAFATLPKLGWGRGRARVHVERLAAEAAKTKPAKPTAKWRQENFISSSLGWGEEEGHGQVIDLQVQGKKSVEVKFKLPAINMTLFSQKCMEDPTCSLDAAVKIPLQCRQAFYYPRADRES